MTEIVIAVMMILLALIFFGFLAFLRYMRYREVLLLAEKGLLGVERSNKNGHESLRWGVLMTALGLALCIGLYPLGFPRGDTYPLNFGPWMLIGLLPLFFGLALLCLHVLTKDERRSDVIASEEEKNVDSKLV